MRSHFISLLFILSLVLSWNCHSEPKTETSAANQAEPASSSEVAPIDRLKSQVVDESDIYGRLRATVSVLQDEYTKSEPTMPGLKHVSVEIGADCILTISNKAYGDEVTRVNLQALDPNGFSLIPDLNEGDFPGLRIRTMESRPAVELLKNGALVTTQPELVIYLANRPAIERITPYMLQALNICQGVQYPD